MTEKCKKCNDELKEAKKEVESLKDQLFNEKKENSIPFQPLQGLHWFWKKLKEYTYRAF